MVPFESLGTVSYSPSIVTVLYHFRDKAICWSKIMIFFMPLAFDAPVMGFPSEYCRNNGVESLKTYFAVSTEYRRVTDRRRDILRRHSPRYA